MSNTEMDKKEKEDLMKAVEELYEKLTMRGIEQLKEFGDGFLSTIYVLDANKNLIVSPIGPEKGKTEALIKETCKGRNVVAVITVAKGWTVRGIQDKPTIPLRHYPGSYEILLATLESREIKRTKEWRIKRDKNGRMIFPLGKPEVILDDFISKYTDLF